MEHTHDPDRVWIYGLDSEHVLEFGATGVPANRLSDADEVDLDVVGPTFPVTPAEWNALSGLTALSDAFRGGQCSFAVKAHASIPYLSNAQVVDVAISGTGGIVRCLIAAEPRYPARRRMTSFAFLAYVHGDRGRAWARATCGGRILRLPPAPNARNLVDRLESRVTLAIRDRTSLVPARAQLAAGERLAGVFERLANAIDAKRSEPETGRA